MRMDFEFYGSSIDSISYQYMIPMVPWTMKFLLAFISERFPLCSWQYKPYLLLMNFLCIICSLCFLIPILTLTEYMALLFFLQLFAAWACVIYDYILLSETTKGRDAIATFQNTIGIFRILGVIIGGCSSAPLWTSLGSKSVYGLLSICYIISFLVSFTFPEEKTMTRVSPDETVPTTSSSLTDGLGLIKDSLLNPFLLVPLLFSIVSGLLPDSSIPTFYVLQDVIKLPSWQFSLLRLIAEIIQICVILLFENKIKKYGIRIIYLVVIILKIFSAIWCYPLVASASSSYPRKCQIEISAGIILHNQTCPLYKEWNLPPFLFAMGDNVFSSATDELAILPLKRITSAVSYHSYGSTVFSLVLSIGNLVSGTRSGINSINYSWWGIDHYHFFALANYYIFTTLLNVWVGIAFLIFFTDKNLEQINNEIEEERKEKEFVEGDVIPIFNIQPDDDSFMI